MDKSWERKRYAVFYSSASNEGRVVDMFARRLWLMRMRLTAWCTVVSAYREKTGTRLVMITLTYKNIDDYKAGHINSFMKNVKQRLGEKLLAFAWVAELQKRGAVHYHVLLLVPKGTPIPKPDQSTLWTYGLTRIETARVPWYIITYVGKEYQKDLARFPKSCRLYAASIRFGDSSSKLEFRALSGLLSGKEGHPKVNPDEWRFMGTAIDKGFAEEVLLPYDTVLK